MTLPPPRRTRLAPSPTGALHLGNARTFFINWLLARQNGWEIALRIEDLDGPRIKRGAAEQAVEDLAWLGIDWDEGPVWQSNRMEPYRSAIARLVEIGHVYPCVCTRSEVDRSASAPHAEDGGAVYPGTCRGRYASATAAREATGRAPAMRFAVGDGGAGFDDGFAGRVEMEVAERLGDFVVAKADGTPAYQLAVVVDDAEMGITDVVRGDDLLDSTARQMLLYTALGWGDRIPRFTHLPLVVGADGRRLAKRHGDTRLATYRAAGVGPGAILNRLATWSGMEKIAAATRATDFMGRFDLARLPRGPIVADAAALAELDGGRS